MQPDNPVSQATDRAFRPDEPGSAALAPTTVLDELLTRPSAPAQAPRASDIVIGELCALNADGQPAVAWPGGPDSSTPAASLAPVCAADIGRTVALGFPAGAGQPLILGFVWQAAAPPRFAAMQAEVDGRHVELEAAETLTLRCGQASITLTADGQVLMRGTYVSSHSTGTQRIKGAAVRIN